MLSFFRRGGTGQILIGAIVFAIIVVFVVEFRAGGSGGGISLKVDCATKVYGECVQRKEFDASRRLVAGRLEQKQQRKLQIPQLIAEGLVERELLVREAERLGVGISETEIDDELEGGRIHVSLPAKHAARLSNQLGLCTLVPHPLYPKEAVCAEGSPYGVVYISFENAKTGRFDYELYKRHVRVQANRSPKEFKKMQRRELIAERMRMLIRSQAVVTEAETFAAYERDTSKAVVRSATLQRDWFARYIVQVSDKVVDDWMSDNEEEVKERWDNAKGNWKAGCSLVSEIRVRFAPDATEEDKVILRGKVDGALKRVEKGEDFAKVARDVSDGNSGVLGGALGCFDADSYGPGGEALGSEVDELGVGDHTGVVESAIGFHVLQLDGKLPEADVEKVGKRHLARDLATRFKAEGEAKKFADELIGELKNGKDLEEATTKLTRKYLARAIGKEPEDAADEELLGLDAKNAPRADVSAPFTRYQQPIPGANPMSNIAMLAFALDKPGTVHPEPIDIGGGVAVIQLKEKMPAKREDFEKEKHELMRRRQLVKGDEALIDYIAALRTAAEDRIEIDPELFAEPKQEGEEGQPPTDDG